MLIRTRRQVDRDTLLRLARQVHDNDGYPIYLPSDLGAFIYSHDALAAWVAESDGEIIGHVALHRSSWDDVMQLARQSTGLADNQLAVVARLLVTATYRRQGVGAALLDHATDHARHLGLRPILDVATVYTPAVGLYERSGWSRLGTVKFPLPEDGTVDEYVFLAPIRHAAGDHGIAAPDR